MKKIDFSKVKVQITFEGEAAEIDFRKSLGNAIRANAGDIALCDFARKIYYSDGEVEIPDEYNEVLKSIIKHNYNYATQEAFTQLLTINKKEVRK